MCGIFGMIRTDKEKMKLKALDQGYLLERLGFYSEDRGTHAGGIAYKNIQGDIEVTKAPGAISKNETFTDLNKLLKFSQSFMGHTRFTTVGTADKNENNHPFKSDFHNYAMAHNGTVSNVYQLEAMFDLPDVKVDTDSFVFSRMLDNTTSGLSHENIKRTAELIKGSFNFTIIDENESVWLVKNNNPLVVVDFEDLGVIAYASTEEIMLSAILDTYGIYGLEGYLSGEANFPKATVHRPEAGEIWEIKTSGEIVKSTFKPSVDYYGGSKWSRFNYNKYDDFDEYESYENYLGTCGSKIDKPKNDNKVKDKTEYLVVDNGSEIETCKQISKTDSKRYISTHDGVEVIKKVVTNIFSSYKGKNMFRIVQEDGTIEKDEFDILSTFTGEDFNKSLTYLDIVKRLVEDQTGMTFEKDELEDLLDYIRMDFNEQFKDNYFDELTSFWGVNKKTIKMARLYLFTVFSKYMLYSDLPKVTAEDMTSYMLDVDDMLYQLNTTSLSSSHNLYDEDFIQLQLFGKMIYELESELM